MTLEADLELRRGGFALRAAFSAPSRGVTAVFGPSGCGKTTLLRVIAGLEPGARGRLRVGGETWQDGRRFVPPHRRALGYVFQEPSLFSHLCVRDNLAYAAKRVPAGERRVAMDEAVGLLALEGLLERDPGALSGGERQRVAIARALLASPRLLLMDEPLASLDQGSKAEILPFLERLHDGLALPLLYVSHAPDEVARLADRVVLMEEGRVLDSGPVGEMFSRLDLPLARGETAESVVEAVVVGHDPDYGLCHLDFPGGRLSVARAGLSAGTGVRLRILAGDVSITLERQSGTSILNIFPVRVAGLVREGPAQVMVRLDAGGAHLLARVTRRSVAELGLEVGSRAFAQVKSVSLLA
ncbi:MAG: molybdenum ABC transporter ATP-binding protein [Chromatiales bacterium]